MLNFGKSLMSCIWLGFIHHLAAVVIPSPDFGRIFFECFHRRKVFRPEIVPETICVTIRCDATFGGNACACENGYGTCSSYPFFSLVDFVNYDAVHFVFQPSRDRYDFFFSASVKISGLTHGTLLSEKPL